MKVIFRRGKNGMGKNASLKKVWFSLLLAFISEARTQMQELVSHLTTGKILLFQIYKPDPICILQQNTKDV